MLFEFNAYLVSLKLVVQKTLNDLIYSLILFYSFLTNMTRYNHSKVLRLRTLILTEKTANLWFLAER
jgi:hypothetical protein